MKSADFFGILLIVYILFVIILGMFQKDVKKDRDLFVSHIKKNQK